MVIQIMLFIGSLIRNLVGGKHFLITFLSLAGIMAPLCFLVRVFLETNPALSTWADVLTYLAFVLIIIQAWVIAMTFHKASLLA